MPSNRPYSPRFATLMRWLTSSACLSKSSGRGCCGRRLPMPIAVADKERWSRKAVVQAVAAMPPAPTVMTLLLAEAIGGDDGVK